MKAKASDHASRGDQFSPSEQRPQAGISYKACACDCCSAGGKENAVRNDNTALASGVALLAATQLPAKASPTFDLKSSTSMLQLWVGEAAVVAEAGLTLAAVEWVATTAAEWATWVIWAAVATATCGRMARGDFNGGSNWHVRNFAHNGNFARNNWNGNWDRPHHFHNRFFVGAPFFYGGYYAYNGYATAPGCGGKPSSPAAPIGGSAIRPACTIRQS